jgi:hypothetical protein
LVAALLAAAAVPLVLRAAPPPVPRRTVQAPLSGASFAAICKNNAVADSRPDPAWVLASYENDNCRAPAMPATLDGTKATRAQIVAGMAAVTRYAGRAQAFEKCIANAVALRKTQTGAATGRSFLLVETHRMLVSEKNRKQADARIAAAINAFNEFGSECAEE